MTYSINTDVCEANNLSLTDVLCMILCKASKGDVFGALNECIENNRIKQVDLLGESYAIPMAYDEKLTKILLDSDNSIPKKSRCEELAGELRSLFPKGMKINTSAWRGNMREITLRLQKFFKLYGDKWTDEEIIEATRKYVEHFNGDYTYMRILKYFIMKSERKTNEEGICYVEEVSELATWLENEDMEESDDNWLTNLV